MNNKIPIVDDAAFKRMMIKDILTKTDMMLLVRQKTVPKP